MIKKVNDRNIITLEDATIKYNNCRFIFVFKEVDGLGGGKRKGYVIYTYDKESESLLIPVDEMNGNECGYYWGQDFDPEPYIAIGNVAYGDY